MAVKIRLMRIGKKKSPKYRIVAIEEGKAHNSLYLDQVGFYDPMLTAKNFTLDEKKVSEWLKKGAQLSEGARKLFGKRIAS